MEEEKKRDKASGLEQLAVTYYKHLKEVIMILLQKVMNELKEGKKVKLKSEIKEGKTVPPTWQEACKMLICKEGNDAVLPQSY